MKLGSSLGPEEDLKEQITRVPEEMDFIEFPLGEKEQMPEDIDREGVIEALEDNDFGLVVHLPFRQRLVTEIDEFNDAVLDYHRRLIRFSKQLGAEKFVIHADMRDNESEEEEELISEQIRRMNKIGGRTRC
ncbi:MAG: sugar phosphate isomerase/epimerase [Candidatus Nanohaloarchaea archaeon]|jgi:sugar phosphate isomerase/epimerase